MKSSHLNKSRKIVFQGTAQEGSEIRRQAGEFKTLEGYMSKAWSSRVRVAIN